MTGTVEARQAIEQLQALSIIDCGSATVYNQRFIAICSEYQQSTGLPVSDVFKAHYYRSGLDAAELSPSRDDWVRREADVKTMRSELAKLVRVGSTKSLNALTIVGVVSREGSNALLTPARVVQGPSDEVIRSARALPVEFGV